VREDRNRITPEVVRELRLLSTPNVQRPMFAVVGALAKR
jgi:hypothetical protein